MRDALAKEEVRVSDLNVDLTYQRVISESKVQLVQNNYDSAVFGNLLVGRRIDGTLWVVDGRHRYEAARRLGMKFVSCLVFASNGRKHEASLLVGIDSR